MTEKKGAVIMVRPQCTIVDEDLKDVIRATTGFQLPTTAVSQPIFHRRRTTVSVNNRTIVSLNNCFKQIITVIGKSA